MTYQATVRRDGHKWTVVVQREDGSVAGGTQAAGLDLVESKVRELVPAGNGDPADVRIDVQIPAPIEQRLQLAQALCDDVRRELGCAQHELRQLDVPVTDIDWLFEHHDLDPTPAAIAITNAEVAAHGLARFPAVIGLLWNDHGRFETITCSSCVENNRLRYADVPPDELNELIRRRRDLLDRRRRAFCDECMGDLRSTRSDDDPQTEGEEP